MSFMAGGLSKTTAHFIPSHNFVTLQEDRLYLFPRGAKKTRRDQRNGFMVGK